METAAIRDGFEKLPFDLIVDADCVQVPTFSDPDCRVLQ